MNGLLVCLCGALLSGSACNKDLVRYESGDIRVNVRQGSEWLHDFPLFMGIKTKNPPQVAVWIEDTQGRYLSTVYVTYRIAHQAWRMSGGNRRKEALPHWCYSRGVQYGDGLYLPTKEEPLTDALSGATPRESFDVKLSPTGGLMRFVVKIEVNQSTDFNDAYPKSAAPGDPNYSGGPEGSGQPALVYAAEVDLASGQKVFEARLVGHSSPDGSDGAVSADLDGLTSALHIVERITVELQ